MKSIYQQMVNLLGVGYWDNQPWKLVYQPETGWCWQPADSTFCPKIWVVARHCYREELRRFPLDSAKEVKNLLALDPDTEQAKVITYTHSEEKVSANLWWLPELPGSPWWVIPETALSAAQLAPQQAQLLCGPHKASYIARTQYGLVSLNQEGMINSSDAFYLAAGISPQQADQEIDKSSHAKHLVNALAQFMPQQGRAFFRQQPLKSALKAHLPSVLSLSLVMVVGYFALSSSYLLWQQRTYQAYLEQQSAQLRQAMQLQQQADKLRQQLEQHQAFAQQLSLKTPLWSAIEPILPLGQLQTIIYRDGRFRLQGEAGQATEVLQTLSRQPNVHDARFEGPTRRQRQRERYQISFLLSNDSPMPETLALDSNSGEQ